MSSLILIYFFRFNMRWVNFFISFFFTLFPIYSYCLFDLIRNGDLVTRKHSIFNNGAIMQVDKGYIPSFFPAVLMDKNLENFTSKNVYPVGSLPKRNSYLCDEGYGFINYKTDRFGLRNPDKNWDKASKFNTVFLIGDSFVHGYCVNEEETLPRKIENISKQNVLNLGFGGNTPNEYIAILRTIVNPILQSTDSENNDVVIVFYENDNIKENKNSFNLALSAKEVVKKYSNEGYQPSQEYLNAIEDTVYKNYSLEKGKIISMIKAERSKNWRADSIIYKFLTLYPIRKRINYLFEEINQTYDDNFAPSISYSIEFLSKICKDSCKSHLIFIPANGKKFAHLKNKESFFINYLEKIALKNNVNFIDGRLIVDSLNSENFSPKRDHLSPEGYEKIVDLFLKKR